MLCVVGLCKASIGFKYCIVLVSSRHETMIISLQRFHTGFRVLISLVQDENCLDALY